MDKCTECPECGCSEYDHEDYIDYGFRICINCHQEWYRTINYKKYSSPSFYYEVFTSIGRSLPLQDRNGDAKSFDKRSVKRRIRKLIKHGWTVTAFVTKPDRDREMIYSNYEPNRMNSIGVKAQESRYKRGCH